MKQNKYNWLFFDADNTLFDFNQSQAYALEASFHFFKLPFETNVNTIYTEVNRQCWIAFEDGFLDQQTLKKRRFELLFEEVGYKVDATLFGKTYLKYLSETNYLIPGARSLLDELRPKYKLAIITNGLKIVQRPRIQNAHLTEYFDSIIVSEEIGSAKPDARFFDIAFSQAGQPDKKEVLVIGDSLNSDIKGGYNYGLDTCWYNPEQKSSKLIHPTFEIKELNDLVPVCGL